MRSDTHKKIRVCFRLEPDLTILIPELLKRLDSRDNISEFLRLAARERFERLAREYNSRPVLKEPSKTE